MAKRKVKIQNYKKKQAKSLVDNLMKDPISRDILEQYEHKRMSDPVFYSASITDKLSDKLTSRKLMNAIRSIRNKSDLLNK